MELCRGCGKDVNEKRSTLNLFEPNNRYLLRRIKVLTNVTLTNNKKLPKLVCFDCKDKINDAYNFRKSFIQTQNYFRERVKLKVPLEGFSEENFQEIPPLDVSQRDIPNEKVRNDRANDVDVHLDDNDNETENPLQLNSIALSVGQSPISPLVENIKEIEFIAIDSHQQNLQNEIETFPMNNLSRRRKKNAKLKHKQDEEVEEVEEEEDMEEEKDEKEYKETEGKQEYEEDKATATFKLCKKNKNVCGKAAKSYVCDQCGNHFTTHHYFIIHQRRHTGNRPYACEICSKKFYTDSELMRHMRKHTGEKPFGCRFCLRRFSDCSTRLKHERTHTNERPFSCTYCAKSFTTSYILKNHMLIHTGEKLFSCELCNRSFSRQTHLVVHNRSILHKQAEEKSKQNACTD